MLRDVSSIQLRGANFSVATILPIFDYSAGKYTKVSLVYGRNGSGKSTIAKAFRKIKGESVTGVNATDVMNQAQQLVVLTKEDCANIFVFDEDFVTENIRIQESGLGAIVMLGEQANLTVQIEQLESDLNKAETMVKSTLATLNEYQTDTNPQSPSFYTKNIRKVLQRNDGWAARDSTVRGLRRNSSVNNATYKKFVALTPEKARDELVIAFNEKMKELELAKKGISKIVETVPSVPDVYKHYSVTLANDLIKKKIEEPELSEREKYLLSLVKLGQADLLQARIDDLNAENATFCPYCLQDLTTDYKMDLIARIQKVLTDEVKHHQAQLKSLERPQLVLKLSSFSRLQSYQSCVDLLATINDHLVSNNALIQRKIENSYVPIIDEELLDIEELIQSLDKALTKLKEERDMHNGMVADTKPIQDTLISINDQIAYYDIINFVERLDIQQKEMDIAQKKYDDAVAYRDKMKKTLSNLNGRRKSIDIAVDVINKELKYILFSEDRLTVERDGDFYKLLSNGHPVMPKNVSVGERNILGLCYFFTSIMTGKKKDTAYKDECLLVIDDPVSSYDFENKVGILSFLKYKLGQFLQGNVNSRAIVMTHDLLTLFDLEKMSHALAMNWKQRFSEQTIKYQYHIWELKDCALKRFEYNHRQEYTELIRLIYNYGCGNAGEYDIVIGNIMRQALEAFSTFEYKKGIEEIATDDTILNRMMCDEYKSYFKNLMYRIVLNNGSHRGEQTRSLKIDFLSVISESEKRRTAQEIICFIYLLHKEHMLAHLGSMSVSSTIDKWCEEIRGRATDI